MFRPAVTNVLRRSVVDIFVGRQVSTSVNDIRRSLCRKIKFSGPLSVAQYMREVLTCPQSGYYVHQDMLGAHGDFITSPELNQMFGELLAIWFITEWSALGSPSTFRFVELGPGRGTLSDDILKVFHRFRKILADTEISYHLVEISDKLSQIQHEKLCQRDGQLDTAIVTDNECFQRGLSVHGNVPLQWHRRLENVPNDKFTFFIAHEFFDALPVHKFVRTNKGWREIYVDVKPGTDDQLRFIQLPEVTLATRLIESNEQRKHVEISPESGVIMESVAQRIALNGGGCLIIDYGHEGNKEDTLRGFKDHKLNDIFENIGEADLTADVDFNFLLRHTKDHNVERSGPITQQTFLKSMGIELRLMMLLRSCKNKDTANRLIESYKIMMDEKHMGERFKVLALTSIDRKDASPVTGFYPATG